VTEQTVTPDSSDLARPLDDPKFSKLESLIRRSFRVRDNRDPVYVDVAQNLDRVGLDQHQIVFGRRGSGKSCLLIHFRRQVAPELNVHTVYILGDTIKTLDYPDVLIRLLLAIFEGLPSQGRWARLKRRVRRSTAQTDTVIAELRDLLALPGTSKLKVTRGKTQTAKTAQHGRLKRGPVDVGADREKLAGESHEEVRESDEQKIRRVDARLADYKRVIQDELTAAKVAYGVFIIDDFYLINAAYQPEVIDYLHRLLRDTDLYLKVGTVRHRTTLLKTSPIHVGVQLTQDVDGFNLDHTLEDIDQTGAYLGEMLRKLGEQVGLEDAPAIMNDDARKELILLSGGVPRDYLNIFVGGLERARRLKGRKRVTPTDLRKAAESLSHETKFRDLRTDAGAEVPALERLFVDLVRFCLQEKRKTAFLVSKDDIGEYPDVHDLIQQLMDFKLIHLIDESTSAASGRPGRFEAYTLDFALFMEPRKRYIEIVRFWETDDQRRRVRLREAPDYPLARADEVIKGEEVTRAEDALDVADEIPDDSPTAEPLKLFE
jgi:glutathione S-transferase